MADRDLVIENPFPWAELVEYRGLEDADEEDSDGDTGGYSTDSTEEDEEDEGEDEAVIGLEGGGGNLNKDSTYIQSRNDFYDTAFENSWRFVVRDFEALLSNIERIKDVDREKATNIFWKMDLRKKAKWNKPKSAGLTGYQNLPTDVLKIMLDFLPTNKKLVTQVCIAFVKNLDESLRHGVTAKSASEYDLLRRVVRLADDPKAVGEAILEVMANRVYARRVDSYMNSYGVRGENMAGELERKADGRLTQGSIRILANRDIWSPTLCILADEYPTEIAGTDALLVLVEGSKDSAIQAVCEKVWETRGDAEEEAAVDGDEEVVLSDYESDATKEDEGEIVLSDYDSDVTGEVEEVGEFEDIDDAGSDAGLFRGNALKIRAPPSRELSPVMSAVLSAHIPKKFLTDYTIFNMENRARVKEDMPGASMGDISKEVARRWNLLKQEAKTSLRKRRYLERFRELSRLSKERSGGAQRSGTKKARRKRGKTAYGIFYDEVKDKIRAELLAASPDRRPTRGEMATAAKALWKDLKRMAKDDLGARNQLKRLEAAAKASKPAGAAVTAAAREVAGDSGEEDDLDDWLAPEDDAEKQAILDAEYRDDPELLGDVDTMENLARDDNPDDDTPERDITDAQAQALVNAASVAASAARKERAQAFRERMDRFSRRGVNETASDDVISKCEQLIKLYKETAKAIAERDVVASPQPAAAAPAVNVLAPKKKKKKKVSLTRVGDVGTVAPTLGGGLSWVRL